MLDPVIILVALLCGLALRALGRYDEAQKDYSLYLQLLES